MEQARGKYKERAPSDRMCQSKRVDIFLASAVLCSEVG